MAQDRVPFTQPIETRDGTLTKDAKTYNGYFEARETKREFVKRPGLLAVGASLPAGIAQGLTYFNGYLYAVVNNVVYKIDPTTYATTTVGTMTGTVNGSVATCYFSQTLNATYLFLHNQVNGYLVNGSTGAFTSVTFPFSGINIVPGAVFIDTYIGVGLPNGRVYTSDPNDPTSWNALDYLTAQQQPDNLVGIGRHLNYVISFGQWSTEFFYDAANSAGSPLSPASTYTIELGCANGDSIVSFEQTIVWIGTSLTVGTGVYLIDGVTPNRVSTPHIDRIINNSNLQNVKAYSMKINGHMLYVLTMIDINKTVVYDLNEQQWYVWTSFAAGTSTYGNAGIYAEQFFKPTFFAGNGLNYFVLDYDSGTLYLINDLYYTDNGAPIYYRIVTENIDSNTTKRKFYSRAEVIGDKIPAVMMIRHSSDDYRTWSSYRSVDLSRDRPQITACGSGRRRAWEFLCTEPQPLRLDAVEVEYTVGGLENEGLMPTHYRK